MPFVNIYEFMRLARICRILEIFFPEGRCEASPEGIGGPPWIVLLAGSSTIHTRLRGALRAPM